MTRDSGVRVAEGVHHVARQVEVVAGFERELLAAERHVQPPGQADERLVLAGVQVRGWAAGLRRYRVLEQRVRVVGRLSVGLHRDAETDRRNLCAVPRPEQVTAAQAHQNLLLVVPWLTA